MYASLYEARFGARFGEVGTSWEGKRVQEH